MIVTVILDALLGVLPVKGELINDLVEQLLFNRHLLLYVGSSVTVLMTQNLLQTMTYLSLRSKNLLYIQQEKSFWAIAKINILFSNSRTSLQPPSSIVHY